VTRRAMTKARKRRIWEANGGVCYHCKEPVDMFGPDVRYDHRIGVWLTERDEDDDVSPAHTWCDAAKTAEDQGRIAKVKRLIKKGVGQPRKPSRIKSRGFAPGKRKLQSRGFPKRSLKGC